jgi:hypothetical protein
MPDNGNCPGKGLLICLKDQPGSINTRFKGIVVERQFVMTRVLEFVNQVHHLFAHAAVDLDGYFTICRQVVGKGCASYERVRVVCESDLIR